MHSIKTIVVYIWEYLFEIVCILEGRPSSVISEKQHFLGENFVKITFKENMLYKNWGYLQNMLCKIGNIFSERKRTLREKYKECNWVTFFLFDL